VGGQQPDRFRAREDYNGRLFIDGATTANDQISPFTKCGANVRIGQSMPNGKRSRHCPYISPPVLPHFHANAVSVGEERPGV
jgi:hypothetical protein